MMNKIFNLTSTFKAHEDDDGSLTIRGLASTPDVDRAGDVISMDAWKNGGLDNYKQNPIILFNHDHNRPIGKAESLEPTERGLELKAKISKVAGDVRELIKDNILGAFSVGFLAKDIEYIEETDGFKIKDAELFEVSVVSVPCNQAATFSLAKSFDSIEEYEEFKKTFTNRVDLAGQSLAGEETNVSSTASDTSEEVDPTAYMEIKMSGEKTPTIDLEALAEKVAEKTTASFAMKQAKQKAAEEKAAKEIAEKAKAAEKRQEEVQVAIKTGTDNLVEDLEKRFQEKEANFDEIVKQFRTELDEKAEELEKLQSSKRFFVDRTSNMTTKQIVEANSDEFMHAHLLGVITGKNWKTDYAKEVFEKAGLDYTTDTTLGDLDQEVRDMIQKEVWYETKVASLFREISVNGRATVLPLQTDVDYATWAINQGFDPAAHGTLENRNDVTANTYKARSVTMTVDRMISSTYIDNDVDEKTLVNLLPMLTQGVARAHARAVENAILLPTGTVSVSHVDDLPGTAAASGTTVSIASPGVATAADLIAGRAAMGKYGLQPSEIAYVVSPDCYYNLIADPEFQNLNEVGEIATKLRGVVGGVFGSPVIVSEEFEAKANGVPFCYIVNRNNYLIPRLRGFRLEQDYEVANQRRMIVATQSLGFTELFDGDGAGNEPVVTVGWVT
jgi:HK97 family phage prohead protease